MANFRAYIGLFLRAEEDKTSSTGYVVKKDTIVQVMNTRWHLAFVGIPGSFEITGKGWSPVYDHLIPKSN